MHEQDKCIKEFEDFFLNNHEWLYNSEGNLNRSFGLLQSIGFKEFLPYLEHRFDHKNYLGISGSGDSEKFKKLFEECKTRMYHQTIRYSKKQRKFLFNSFFPLAIKNQIPILHLSGTLSQQETEERCEDFMRRTLFDQETPKNRIPDKFYCRYLMNHRQEQFNPINRLEISKPIFFSLFANCVVKNRRQASNQRLFCIDSQWKSTQSTDSFCLEKQHIFCVLKTQIGPIGTTVLQNSVTQEFW
ncbi:MAG: hypothetical protein MHMPM18_002308 [Marteilia pararefringens]